eukprot:maker-scaffold1299_size49759-snap-gene-0.15 protein:Tk03392 transcript:maker-scaffold1299_size49759-snap-gene-0.15-mRNA-1 annotation:"hypothetical protein GV64_14105"
MRVNSSRPDYSYFHLYPEEIQAVTLMSIRQGNIFNYFDWGSETPKFVLEDARATGAVYLASGVKTASSKMYSSKAKGMHVSEQGTEYGLQLTFLLPKYAPWLPRVSQVMSWVVDSGIIDKFARVDKPPKPQDMGPIRISLDHMTALLILLAVGYFCAILTPKEEMVVKNGKIAYVGSTSEAMGFNVPGTTRVVDLARKTVLPGFHDTHMHPLESRHKAAGTCMLTKDTKPEDQFQVFRNHCFDNQKGTNRTLGWGHSVWTLLDYVERTGKDPKKLLDPLIVDPSHSHGVHLPLCALELAGITKDTKNEKGSIYMRNPVTDEPNEIVLENAGNKMFEAALDPNLYPALRQMNFFTDQFCTLCSGLKKKCF